ncbi:hypothetical protein IAQ61_010632 [Plenodomus lingam]|uniref:uncharacterized protein n=1 Tax=Leptosphaeria maculans TaxID=5022 RepID=UPI0033218EFD|nr:hypothetical protein IAQ61_010632 [Plenodomus lingam]
MSAPEPPTKQSPFFTLPLELREQIYSLYHKPADRLVRNHILDAQGLFGGVYEFDFALWRANKQVYEEARRVWRRENVFMKIGLPWPSAGIVNHISAEGLVPIVCTDEKADLFENEHALVQITAPFHQTMPEHMAVILVDDVHLFSQIWFYSALSYPMMNDRLATTFILQDPYNPGEEKPNIPLSLQRRLLLPFEHIKGLYSLEIRGYDPSVEAELRRRMAVPLPTLVEYLDQATDLLVKGDAILKANQPEQALEVYVQAFKAIHIIINGRTRRVLADVFFHQLITTGRYSGQTGMTVRVMLRLRLVARTIVCYLALSRFDEAAFWGMRSIRIMREAMDIEFEEFLSEFVGGSDVGLIYMRTGVAFWNMEQDRGRWGTVLHEYREEEDAKSELLWEGARRHLGKQSKEAVRRELGAYGVPREVVSSFRDEEGRRKEGSVVAEDGSGEE